MAYLLPLSLTIRAIRTTRIHIEVDGVIEDARGQNVQHYPVSVDIKTTGAELDAILQNAVQQITTSLYERKLAELPPITEEPELEELVGRVFRGSMTR